MFLERKVYRCVTKRINGQAHTRNGGINISDNGKEERKVGRYTTASKQASKKERKRERKKEGRKEKRKRQI